MPLRPIVNLSIEFGPIIVFLITYQFSDFFVGVQAFIIATIIAVLVAFIRERRVAWFPLILLASTLLFGLTSLETRSSDVFIVKDTIADLLFAAFLIISVRLGTPALKILFDATFAMTKEGWDILTLRWGYFYFVLGVINEVIRRMFSDDVWVEYKFLAVLATLLFGVYQFRLSMKTRIPEESNWLGLRLEKEPAYVTEVVPLPQSDDSFR